MLRIGPTQSVGYLHTVERGGGACLLTAGHRDIHQTSSQATGTPLLTNQMLFAVLISYCDLLVFVFVVWGFWLTRNFFTRPQNPQPPSAKKNALKQTALPPENAIVRKIVRISRIICLHSIFNCHTYSTTYWGYSKPFKVTFIRQKHTFC